MKTYLIPATALLLSLVSCTEDVMDRVNENKGNPPIEIVYGKFEITDAMANTGATVASGDYAFYTSVYNEQIFGGGGNQLRNAELRQVSEPGRRHSTTCGTAHTPISTRSRTS